MVHRQQHPTNKGEPQHQRLQRLQIAGVHGAQQQPLPESANNYAINPRTRRAAGALSLIDRAAVPAASESELASPVCMQLMHSNRTLCLRATVWARWGSQLF